MNTKTEILFVDPAVSDLPVVLRGLRPDVDAVVLSPDAPAARQIAAALEGKAGLAAVHLMAHGAPGRVMFSGGAWSAGSLEWDAGDLAAIGGALGDDGELRLWSCNTAAGATGAAFIAGLAERAGADVAAATLRVGAADKGGAWTLDRSAHRPAPLSPLTEAGMESFEGVLAYRVKVSGPIADGDGVRQITYSVVDKTTKAVLGQFVLPNAARGIQGFRLLVDISALADAYDVGVFDEASRFVSSGYDLEAPPGGAVGAAT